jgi:hypothetical protein
VWQSEATDKAAALPPNERGSRLWGSYSFRHRAPPASSSVVQSSSKRSGGFASNIANADRFAANVNVLPAIEQIRASGATVSALDHQGVECARHCNGSGRRLDPGASDRSAASGVLDQVIALSSQPGKGWLLDPDQCGHWTLRRTIRGCPKMKGPVRSDGRGEVRMSTRVRKHPEETHGRLIQALWSAGVNMPLTRCLPYLGIIRASKAEHSHCYRAQGASSRNGALCIF